MSNFLLWLIAQNTAQSLAHQMQKDNPVGWLRTQLFFWTGTIVVTLVLLYFALPEAFWTIVLTPVVIANRIRSASHSSPF